MAGSMRLCQHSAMLPSVWDRRGEITVPPHRDCIGVWKSRSGNERAAKVRSTPLLPAESRSNISALTATAPSESISDCRSWPEANVSRKSSKHFGLRVTFEFASY